MRLRPQTTHLIAVLGNSPLERAWQEELAREFQPLADRLTVTWFNELSFTEMLKRSAALPANSAIFYLLLSVDAKGFTQSEERVLAELHETANAPIFGAFSHQIGRGVVGGPILSVDDVARDTASVGVRLLSGESAAAIKTGILAAQRPITDWRELQRWQIPESRLPSGAIVSFRSPSLWEERKGFILAGAAIVLFQAALITALLFQRTRRRSAEHEMMGLSGRLLTAHEDERRRLARELHDDLTQRLARLAIDAGKLEQQGGVAAGSAAGMRKELVRLSEDVHALSYRLHPSMLDDLGLVEALRAECDRVAQHSALRVEVDATHVPDKLPAETALCLFRVAQEALNNTARHAGASAVTVLLSPRDNGLRLGSATTVWASSHKERARARAWDWPACVSASVYCAAISISKAHRDVARRSLRRSPHERESMTTKPRVLLADDHRMVTEGLRSILEKDFELAGIVEDGRSLLTAVAELRPDVIVADISMPNLNGLDALAQLKRDNPKVRVVFLTMHREAAYARRALEAGAAGYVLKNAAPAELVLAIHAALQGRTFITPDLAAEMLGAGKPTGVDPVAALTERQREILRLLVVGKSAKEIASALDLSARTVEDHSTG